MSRFSVWAIVTLLIVLGLARIASTYTVFTFSSDERAHLLTGMEWLDRGTYEFEVLHPPLGRVVAALPLYLEGKRLEPEVRASVCPRSFVEDYRRVEKNVKEGFFKSYCLPNKSSRFLTSGDIQQTLILMRGAESIFYIIASLYVFLLGRRWLGEKGGLAALFVFTMTPVVLGISSLALTDMTFTATFLMSLHAIICLLEQPRWRMVFYAGVALGLAFISKFSALVFLPIGAVVLIFFRAWQIRAWPLPPVKYIAVSILICFCVIWSAYRFSVGTPAQVFPAAETMSHAEGFIPNLMTKDILPMPEFFQGILAVAQKSEKGHGGYLFGKIENHGVWYFFPSQILLRTPIPIVALFLIGTILIIRDARQRKNLTAAIPLLLFGLMLAAVIPSRINIGLRHVIHLYAPLAMIAGYALVRFSESGRKWRLAGLLSAVSVVIASAMAHPYYYSDYWKIFDPNPECCINVPDLDFNLDRKRIAEFVDAKNIPEITVCGLKTDIYAHYTDKKIIQFCPQSKPEGWFAISLNWKYNEEATRHFAWLTPYQPVMRLGTSIDVYYFPPEE